MRNPTMLWKVRLAFLIALPLAPLHVALAGEPERSADNVAQVVSISGHAVFARDHNTLMDYGGERKLDMPNIQLHQGQWLHAGNAILVRENSVVVLRQLDGREEKLGPHTGPTETVIRPLHKTIAVTSYAASPAQQAAKEWLGPFLAFERHHRPVLLFVLGTILTLMSLLRRKPYQPGFLARLVATALLVGLVLPVSFWLFALQLGRMAWYQPPMPSMAWTGNAATLAHMANIAALVVTFAGIFALWVLSVSFISGGSTRLMHRGRLWWMLCGIALVPALVGYLAPRAPNLDFESEWYRFYLGWARYYSAGTWLLLPLAHLTACARPLVQRGWPWQGAAASGLMIIFLGCYAIGYDVQSNTFGMAHKDEAASRTEARRWLCAADNVFIGHADNFHIVNEPHCTSPQPRSPGDTSGRLQRCEIAEANVQVVDVLHSLSLKPGQTVAFQVAHARVQLDGLKQGFEGETLLFHTDNHDVDGRTVQIGSPRPGIDRLSPFGTNNAGDAIYARSVLAECQR